MQNTSNWSELILSFDDRRNIAIPGDKKTTIQFCIEHFIDVSAKAIADHGFFAVALSGGSTPKALFQTLTSPENIKRMEWQKFLVFWSDERSVPPDNSESNYSMAMASGFDKAPIPKQNIFRMVAEDDVETNAKTYEELIRNKVKTGRFDLILLGMGDDGHTASLFPRTHALHTNGRLVVANYVPQHNTWRMTFTFDCINAANHIAIDVTGKNKAEMVKNVLTGTYDPDTLPIQRVGTPEHKALWILDKEAASLLNGFSDSQKH
jgi:6-phosphogluconolactonase